MVLRGQRLLGVDVGEDRVVRRARGRGPGWGRPIGRVRQRAFAAVARGPSSARPRSNGRGSGAAISVGPRAATGIRTVELRDEQRPRHAAGDVVEGRLLEVLARLLGEEVARAGVGARDLREVAQRRATRRGVLGERHLAHQQRDEVGGAAFGVDDPRVGAGPDGPRRVEGRLLLGFLPPPRPHRLLHRVGDEHVLHVAERRVAAEAVDGAAEHLEGLRDGELLELVLAVGRHHAEVGVGQALEEVGRREEVHLVAALAHEVDHAAADVGQVLGDLADAPARLVEDVGAGLEAEVALERLGLFGELARGAADDAALLEQRLDVGTGRVGGAGRVGQRGPQRPVVRGDLREPDVEPDEVLVAALVLQRAGDHPQEDAGLPPSPGLLGDPVGGLQEAVHVPRVALEELEPQALGGIAVLGADRALQLVPTGVGHGYLRTGGIDGRGKDVRRAPRGREGIGETFTVGTRGPGGPCAERVPKRSEPREPGEGDFFTNSESRRPPATTADGS